MPMNLRVWGSLSVGKVHGACPIEHRCGKDLCKCRFRYFDDVEKIEHLGLGNFRKITARAV